jgi:hypothetical protein
MTQKGLPTNRDDPPKPEVYAFREHDCLEVPEERRLLPGNTTFLRGGDTVYIPLKKLQRFILETLDQVTVPILIISGQVQLTKNASMEAHIGTLLGHPMVLAWFCQNLDIYAAPYLHHHKVFPWPYGLADAPFRHQYTRRELYRQAVHDKSLSATVSKEIILYLVYVSVLTNQKIHLSIPNGKAAGPSQNTTATWHGLASSFRPTVTVPNVIDTTKPLGWERCPLRNWIRMFIDI